MLDKEVNEIRGISLEVTKKISDFLHDCIEPMDFDLRKSFCIEITSMAYAYAAIIRAQFDYAIEVSYEDFVNHCFGAIKIALAEMKNIHSKKGSH